MMAGRDSERMFGNNVVPLDYKLEMLRTTKKWIDAFDAQVVDGFPLVVRATPFPVEQKAVKLKAVSKKKTRRHDGWDART